MKIILIAFFSLVFFQFDSLEIYSAHIHQGKKLFRADELNKNKLLLNNASSRWAILMITKINYKVDKILFPLDRTGTEFMQK